MGWAAGSELADEVWTLFREFIPSHHRKHMAAELMELFEQHDADAWGNGTLLEEDAGYLDFEDETLLEDEE